MSNVPTDTGNLVDCPMRVALNDTDDAAISVHFLCPERQKVFRPLSINVGGILRQIICSLAIASYPNVLTLARLPRRIYQPGHYDMATARPKKIDKEDRRLIP